MSIYHVVRKLTVEIFLTLIGTLIMAAGIAFFLLPNQLSTGGFSGVATILYYLFKMPMRKDYYYFKYTIIYFCNV